ncbi:amino acid deaminase/aldolase, partial [Leucobacter sp. M11]|uniref:amino acid deaminase/aldolase n=1 Tax=Leucobacter sp. M11 TaxID=2993565 RepID=UPI002D8032CC
MSVDLSTPAVRAEAEAAPWAEPAAYWPALSRAVAAHSAPALTLGLGALAANAADLSARGGGLPIRVASKSIRSRPVIEALLRLPATQGVLAYSLAEAVWLSSTIADIVVAYPSVDRGAFRALVADDRALARVAVMIDDPAQLDLIDAVVPVRARGEIRVCLDFDASWQAPLLGHLGVRRSPVRTADALARLAARVVARPGFRLVGVMSYEAQIAGVANHTAGKPVDSATKQWMQRSSHRELLVRRGEAIARVREVADLEFVNGGGTGSIERTAQDPSITDIAAGSGYFGPHLFDHYRSF